ncbi:hypothetical protein B0H19DRAFT_1378987 [Mycena capillaripes]|nr:hypothetical protein B0H19DRAFT_1378987 [Mycena capillaripes]
MKPENLLLRRRLSDIESELQMECPPNRSHRLMLKQKRQLMKEKITVQASLNLIVYPILILPVEITTEIFLHCLPSAVVPLRLSRVCQQWRDIAYSNPRLWTVMKIGFQTDDHRGFHTFIRDWLLRAGTMALTLHFIILPDRRWGNSDPTFTTPTLCSCLKYCPFTDSWGRLTSFHGDDFTPAECLQLLTHATRLVRCDFRHVVDRRRSPSSVTPLILPELTYLGFAYIDHAALFVGVFYLSWVESALHSFLKRTPSIQWFRYDHYQRVDLYDPHSAIPNRITRFTHTLDVMPFLTSLSVSVDITHDIFDIFDRLSGPTRTFLPHLRKLALSIRNRMAWKDQFTGSLVGTLTSRWDPKPGVAQLLDFEFCFLLTWGATLDRKVVECVSELKKKGMRIHVGGPRV